MNANLRRRLLCVPHAWLVFGVIAVSTLMSIGITLVTTIWAQYSRVDALVALAIATTVPICVAWPVSHLLIKMMRELDAARAEAVRLANTDPLTGVLNRRRFIELAEGALQRSQHADAPSSLLLLDVDDFKQVNDHGGHDAGDVVLQSVARSVMEALRPNDILARWGGEEFVALLSDTAQGEAVRVAFRLRDAVQVARLPRPGPGAATPVTVSIGVACSENSARSLDELVSLADLAMYAAKRQGKNTVVDNIETQAPTVA